MSLDDTQPDVQDATDDRNAGTPLRMPLADMQMNTPPSASKDNPRRLGAAQPPASGDKKGKKSKKGTSKKGKKASEEQGDTNASGKAKQGKKRKRADDDSDAYEAPSSKCAVTDSNSGITRTRRAAANGAAFAVLTVANT